MELEKKHLDWIDILKGILIFIVVIDHSYPPTKLETFFTPFFLTTFFVLSGFTFSSKKGFWDFLKNRSYRLLLPFVFLGIPKVLITCYLNNINYLTGLKDFFLQINRKGDEMWFLPCIFVSSLIFYGLLKVSEKVFSKHRLASLVSVSVLLFALSICNFMFWHVNFIWQFETATMMILYMAIGYFLKEYPKITTAFSQKLVIPISCFVAFCFLQLLFPNDCYIHIQQFAHPFTFIANSIISIPWLFALAMLLSKIKIKYPFIFMGENTLLLYGYGGLGRMAVDFIKKLTKITINPYVYPIISAVLGVLILIIPCLIINRLFPFVVGRRKNR